MPDGNTATEAEMVAAMQTLKRYNTDVSNYVKCLEFEATQNRLSREDQARQHNAAIDGLQVIAAKFREVEVGPAVVVEVAGRGAQAIDRDVQPRRRRDVGERAIVVVAVERRRGAFRGLAGPRLRIDEEEILPPVAVGVEDDDARPHRLGKVLLAESPVFVPEGDPGLVAHVPEEHPGRLVPDELRTNNLQSHWAPEVGIDRFVGYSHAAMPEL